MLDSKLYPFDLTALLSSLRFLICQDTFKNYISDSERRKKSGKEGWEWLIQRCEGADNIRNLIKEKNLKYFSVPDKWIYVLPTSSKKTEKRDKTTMQPLVTEYGISHPRTEAQKLGKLLLQKSILMNYTLF